VALSACVVSGVDFVCYGVLRSCFCRDVVVLRVLLIALNGSDVAGVDSVEIQTWSFRRG
jgi:hypothetical protein